MAFPMALADGAPRVVVRGEWPEPATLRRGWARAEARRWNETNADASLRLVRGGAVFLEACAHTLLSLGAPSVLSPPLPESTQRVWKTAGFTVHTELALMRATLEDRIPTTDHLVVQATVEELDDMLDIDQAAFDEFWQFDRLGLMEAVEATGRSEIYVIRGSEGRAIAYAVIGFGHAISYLQRAAVSPEWQGNGMGRSLVRAVMRRAQASGARAILLNTQFDNERAISLYRSEGFTVLPDPLALLRVAA